MGTQAVALTNAGRLLSKCFCFGSVGSADRGGVLQELREKQKLQAKIHANPFAFLEVRDPSRSQGVNQEDDDGGDDDDDDDDDEEEEKVNTSPKGKSSKRRRKKGGGGGDQGPSSGGSEAVAGEVPAEGSKPTAAAAAEAEEEEAEEEEEEEESSSSGENEGEGGEGKIGLDRLLEGLHSQLEPQE
eukprot:804767-Rhodomonas_salina.1